MPDENVKRGGSGKGTGPAGMRLMLRRHARTASIAALCGALAASPAPAAAQHEQHGVPDGVAQVLVTGTAWGAQGTPLRGAIVQLFHGAGPGRHLMATSVTDADGRFALRAAGGTYVLEIRHLGHEPHRREVILGTTPVNAGTARLEPAPRVLDAVTVSGEGAAVELRSGATIVRTRASAGTGGSIADLLRTVPGIEINADGRIGIRGSTNVLVLMDGRRVPLSRDALVAFLRQMPATALERIETGMTESARQDADGAAGVVNLVFREDAVPRTGMRSLAGSMATADHYMGSASVAGDVRDVLTWDARYSMSGMRPLTDSRTTRWNLVARDPVRRTDQDSRGRATHRLHSIMLGTALAPVPSMSLALRGAYSRMDGASRTSTAFVDTDTAGIRWNNATNSTLEHSIPASEVTVAARVERGRIRFASEGRASFVDEDFRGDYATGAGLRFMTTDMTARHRERVVRNDIGLRFAGVGVDLGQQSRFRTTSARHDDASHDGATLSRLFRYEADVHAGYLAAHRSIAGVRAQAGLRLEADRTRILRETASTRTAVRVFPSIGGEWSDARRSLLYRFGYGRRIDRPGPEMVNPFSMGEDDMNEIIGNPSLVPEVSDQVEVGIERRGGLAHLQLTPFLRWTRDPIRALKTVTASGRSTTTLENLTSTRSAGADGSLRTRLSGGTVVTVAGSVARMETTADTFSTSGVYLTARLIVDHPLTENTTAQLYAYRRSAQAIEQGEILPTYTSELALTRRLAGDRGRLTLRLSDPFRSDRLEFRIADSTFRQESHRRTARPLLSLYASWAVGGSSGEDAPARSEDPPRIF